MRDGSEPDWPALDEGAEPGRVLGTDRFPASEAELAADLIAPVIVYPLFESALWARAGGTHRAAPPRGSASCGRATPRSPPRTRTPGFRGARSAEQIATPGQGNRLVSLPYTKLLNSNIQTDQAAALILCSAETAQALGVPRERWVFPHAAAHAHDHWFVSERARPALLAGDPPRRARRARARGHVDRRDRPLRHLLVLSERGADRLRASSASTRSPTSAR